jgi:guanylate kinase
VTPSDPQQLDPDRDDGVLLVVSGPSGTGKSTLCQAAMRRFGNLEFSVSYTTRAPRAGEVHGRDYFFVDDATFDRMIEAHAFAEWARVHDHKYGTSLEFIQSRIEAGVNVVLDIDPQGAAQIKSRYGKAVFIFFIPPSPAVLESRLRGRGTDSEAVILRRLQNSVDEIRQCTWYDYIIVNDDFERALEKFTSVILAEKCRRSRSTRLISRTMAEYGIRESHDSTE